MDRGWPPPAGGKPHSSGAGSGQQSPQSSTALPPPPPGGPFPQFHQQPPSLASLAGLSQYSPRQPPPSTGRQDQAPPLSQEQQLPLPGITQATGQPSAAERERERERVREEQIHIKEEEDRRYREQQERQRFEQAPPHHSQPGHPMPLHQPVAVGPRSVHGPNGLLGGPQPQPQMPLGAPSGPGNIFAGGPVQPSAQSQAQGPGGQQMQPGMLMPFAPAPQSQQQQQIAQQGQGQGQQPILNDALSYLDQVKVQFADHPDVYNRFLDIMKDFKSGAIDTPGVIGRVSTLFAGNPDLIQGFNTFLPPGYRIECGADNDPHSIRVTTPMGTTVSSMPSRQIEGGVEVIRPGTFTPQPGQNGSIMFSPSGRPAGPSAPGQHQQISPMEAARQQEQQQMHQQEQRGVSSLQNAISAATSGVRPGVSPRVTPLPGQSDPNAPVDAQGGPPGIEKRGPVEFNHAISYVNKIKNRFVQHPDIYKQFLEILQTYQRESKPIQDVYSQVTTLFKSAPDLLEDFKQFLPESAAHARAAERARQEAEANTMLSNVRGEPGYGSPVMSREGPYANTPSHGRAMPPIGNFAPTPISKDNKRKRGERGERQGTVGSIMDGPGPNKAPYGQQGKRVKQTHAQAGRGPIDQPPSSPTLIPRLPEPLPPTTTSAATHDEISFFDRVKKAIGNKNTMNEFLKLCNLFSQDLIDRTALVFRAHGFIGNHPELMKYFIDFVGYDEKDIVIENKVREPMLPGGRVSLSNCRGLGPSYRLLPKRERNKLCSGRDELCNSVLNDEWASHPTWASEDSGFIAHRKNVHEEGLHRIEEERHDYDFNIEACTKVIQLLEPIAQQLRRMSTIEEQVAFKLGENIGGTSVAVYQRVIFKLYGRAEGRNIIEQLKAAPYQVIPVILNRMKERLESWKIAQREWEKVWRDQTQKMFWKSLDHQAASAKTSDKRQFQTKSLQGEVQVKYEEQKREEMRTPGAMRGKPQLEVTVEDEDVIVDATYLLLISVDTPANTEAPRLGPWIRDFVPMFFGIDPEVFERKLSERAASNPHTSAIVDEYMSGAEDSGGERRGRKIGNKTTLLRQTLDKGPRGRFGRKGGDDSNASNSRASTPDATSLARDDAGGDGMAIDTARTLTPAFEDGSGNAIKTDVSRWFHHPITDNAFGSKKVDPNEPQKRTTYRLWGNTPIFCFVRMLLFLYERLYKLKMSENECREVVRNAKKSKPADELGLIDKMPQNFFADISPNANYYRQMLDKFAAVLESELDFANDGVEECLRRFYLQAGFPLYAFEKIITSLVRYGTQIVFQEGNKEKSWDILALYKKDRLKGNETSAVQATDYRKAVEKLIGGGEEYALDWDSELNSVRIFIVKRDDPFFSADGLSQLDQQDKWRYYIASYTSVEDTDGVNRKDLQPVLLSRNIEDMGADPHSERFPPLPIATAPTESADGVGENSNATDSFSSVEARVENSLLARFLAAKNDERLMLRIAVDNYGRWFSPNTAESFFVDMRLREGGEEGVREAEEVVAVRKEAVRESEMNNEGMRDMSREDVQRRNEEFRVVEVGGEAGVGERMEVDG